VVVSDQLAVFLGVNGHYAARLSVGISALDNHISVHGLLHLEFLDEDSRMMVGVTRHKLVFALWEELPLKIYKISNQ
jgi:hypothetical protein